MARLADRIHIPTRDCLLMQHQGESLSAVTDYKRISEELAVFSNGNRAHIPLAVSFNSSFTYAIPSMRPTPIHFVGTVPEVIHSATRLARHQRGGIYEMGVAYGV